MIHSAARIIKGYMSSHNLKLGRVSESLAADYLKNKGYKIIAVNYHTRFGEIDIIAEDSSVVCFIEVKSRADYSFGHPKEAITPRKQYKISQNALAYIKDKGLLERSCRFDVLTIIAANDRGIEFELLKDAFYLAKKYS